LHDAERQQLLQKQDYATSDDKEVWRHYYNNATCDRGKNSNPKASTYREVKRTYSYIDKSESIVKDQYETRLKQQDADLQTARELDIQDDNERQQLLDHSYGKQGGPTPQDDDAWQYYHDSIYQFLVGYYYLITASMYDNRRHALEAEKAEALYT